MISGAHDKTGTAPAYLVLGATGGIGSELCRRLVKKGASVLAASRDGEKLAALQAAAGVAMASVDAIVPDQVEHAVEEAVERFGRLDGVAHCVGSLLLKPAHLTKDEDWARTLEINLTSAFYLVRAATRRMMKSGGGTIVLISSAAARTGLANHEAIGAAKAGIIGLALSAASTYAPQNVRVNVVAPGMVRTPLTERLTSSPASLKASTALHALGRIGSPAEIASAIEWLLDPEQSWVTGQVLGVDGGLATVRPRATA